ncbi:hypothetical protein ACWGPD_11175 [Streptomyces hirsutus]|uniref:hypothetical protein n=1 Tax=Streptomyces hirsutus TaxID=35620 RepID=UPI003636160C
MDNAIARLSEDRASHDRDIRQLRTDYEKDVDEIQGDVDQLTTRTNSLENWRYAVGAALLMSSASAVGAAVSIVPR